MFASLGRVMARIGIGLAAGAVGTAAMTIAQTIEMKITDREGSTVPADVVDEIAGVAPEEPSARARMAQFAHWGYGIGLGALRGALASTPLPPRVADSAFYLMVWTAPMAYMPALGVAPPPTEWGSEQIVSDAAFHLVYASAVAGAWHLLTKDGAVEGS